MGFKTTSKLGTIGVNHMNQNSPPSRSGAIIRFFTRAKTFFESPACKVGIGLCLVLTAVAEIVDAIVEDAHKLGGHHGLLVFGVGQIGTHGGTFIKGAKNSYLGWKERRRAAEEAKNNPPAGGMGQSEVPAVASEPRPADDMVPQRVLRSVTLRPGRVVLSIPGLLSGGNASWSVLVQRLLAVPGVERVETGGDAVTMHLVGGATPGPGLLKATAAAIRADRLKPVSWSPSPSGSPVGSTLRAS